MKIERLSNGYKVVYDPLNPSSMTSKNWNGWIYEHIQIAEKIIGRQLLPNEEVHHKDFNRLNNAESNLEVLTIIEHRRLHHKTKGNLCRCGKEITRSRHKFCSMECRTKFNTKFPGVEHLKECLKTGSYSSISKEIGVSDKTIKKWCIKFKLI